ncbi:MAG: diaminopimelate dehydrogenase [Bacteroidales bacterium]|jgi:diaminopimelate dehydrogenase|nr:diaminopimelate dehydrogenase [Bacteroidales bacterium]
MIATEKIRIGIAGYGNLGIGVEAGISQNPDMELIAVFTRREPESLKIRTENVPVCRYSDIEDWAGKADVMILCGGSATDLVRQVPHAAQFFNTVDSFDTHARIPGFYSTVNEASRSSGHTSIISVGWDPGMFSIARVYSNCILPIGKDYTFWGPGVSQGHSDAIRRIRGVADARQYTMPVDSSVQSVRNGDNPELTAGQKHTRLCYVVAEEGADLLRIEKEIKEMPDYFREYETTVKFIPWEDLKRNHSEMPHGGFVIRSGVTGVDKKQKQIIEYSLKLESNPGFTANVLIAFARAAYRLSCRAEYGAKTVFDIPPALLSPLPGTELIKRFL